MTTIYSSGTQAPEKVSTPTITNFTATLADTEYSFMLPAQSKRFMLKSRNHAALKIAWVSGQTTTTYLTLPSGTIYSEDELNSSTSFTLYFQSALAGDIIEIESWV